MTIADLAGGDGQATAGHAVPKLLSAHDVDPWGRDWRLVERLWSWYDDWYDLW
jgi:hypothetical protein